MMTAPWLDVQPRDFVHAAEAGTQAGLEGARLDQTGQIAGEHIHLESARLAQEARQHADAINQAQDQLSQQATLAQMEMESRQKIAEQAHIQDQQRMAIENAYKQAEIGLGAGRLNQEQVVADAKAREKAMEFAHIQGYSQAIQNGMTPAQALFQFPMAGQGVVNALQHADAADAEEMVHAGSGVYLYNRKNKNLRTLLEPTQAMAPDEKLKLSSLYNRQRDTEKAITAGLLNPTQLAAAQKTLSDINQQLRDITGDLPPDAITPGPSGPDEGAEPAPGILERARNFFSSPSADVPVPTSGTGTNSIRILGIRRKGD